MPDDKMLRWLTYPLSLTEELKRITKQSKVQLVKQEWEQAGWWEHCKLQVIHSKVLVREVIVSSNNIPCWYARTTIPKATYESYEPIFLRLNKEPLGNIIFHEQSIERQTLDYYPVDKDCIEYYWLDPAMTDNQERFWVRFSEFLCLNKEQKEGDEQRFKHPEGYLRAHPFYLVEVFLPGLLRVTS